MTHWAGSLCGICGNFEGGRGLTGSLVILRMEKQWDHGVGSLGEITGYFECGGALGGITGNFGGEAIGSLGGIAGRDHW